MGDLVLIRGKGKGGGNGKGGGGEEPPSNPSPRRPRKPIIRNENIKPFIEDPSIDPNLISLIDLPIPLPVLRKEIYRQNAANPVEKEINLMQRYKEKPLLFWRDELGISIESWINDKPPKDWKPGDPLPLWSKQRDIINALVQHRKVAVKSGHGIGKCRGWYDPILLSDGSLVPANELIGKFFQVLSYKNGKQVIRTARAEDNGVKDCIRIYYKDGNQEIVTLNHPLWSTDPQNKINRIVPSRSDKREFGFREAKDLVVGDCIASPIKIDIEGKEVLDDRLVKFLAYVIGDGCLTQGVTFSQQDNKQLQEFKTIVESYGCSLTRTAGNKYDYDVVGRKGFFIRLAESFDLLGKTSYEKNIPKEITQSSDRQISIFLSRLYATDGWVSFREENNRDNGQIGYSTASYDLAFQIQYLLKRLGIYGSIRESWASWIYKGIKKKSKHYVICITSKEDILNFCSNIFIYGKEDKQKKLESLVKSRNTNYTQKWKRLNIIPGFEWNEITKIEKLEFPTVAIEVEDTHTFITPFSYEHNTHLAAGITLYLTYVWHATGMTTAPSFRQVRRALWGEIHYQYARARVPLGGKINQVSLDLGPKWFVEGFATDKPMDNITGIHEENIFVIVDEAGGVAHSVFESLDALLTSESTFVLYIGNPTDPTSPFADAFKPGSGFKTFTLSCYDCPNVRHDRIIYPKLTVKKWVDDKEKKWGRDSNLFRIRVLGEFPQESKDTLIPIRFIEKALEKGREGVFLPDQIHSFGLDVARQGSDSSTYGIRYKSGFFCVQEATQKKRETETAGKMIDIYNELIPEFKYRNLNEFEKRVKKDKQVDNAEEGEVVFPPINVDDIGVGGGVVDILLEEEYPTNGVNVAEPPDPSDPDEAKLFLNKRAQYYWNLKKLFERELVAIDDDELAFELSKLKVEFLRSGKIKIVDKDTIKKDLGGRSPDRAECMMLAFSMDYADVERELVRFL